MPRKRNTAATVEDESAVTVDVTADDATVGMNDDKNSVTIAANNVTATTTKRAAKATIADDEEIEVESLVPNVSYKDSRTGDMYEWVEVGHIEYMTFEVLKNLWRNHKGYFRNLVLRPLDDRVINQFGLTSVVEKYEFLMQKDSYTRKNINKVVEIIKSTPNGLKHAVCTKIREMVVDGDMTDIVVIRTLENQLDMELVALIS